MKRHTASHCCELEYTTSAIIILKTQRLANDTEEMGLLKLANLKWNYGTEATRNQLVPLQNGTNHSKCTQLVPFHFITYVVYKSYQKHLSLKKFKGWNLNTWKSRLEEKKWRKIFLFWNDSFFRWNSWDQFCLKNAKFQTPKHTLTLTSWLV